MWVDLCIAERMSNFLLLRINPNQHTITVGSGASQCCVRARAAVLNTFSLCSLLDTGGTTRTWEQWIPVTPSPSPYGRASLTLHRGLLWTRPTVALHTLLYPKEQLEAEWRGLVCFSNQNWHFFPSNVRFYMRKWGKIRLKLCIKSCNL